MQKHLRDTIYLAKNYRELQSSGSIVLGLGLISEGIRLTVWDSSDQLIVLYYVSLFALLGLIYHELRSYYDNRFGRVESSSRSKKQTVLLILWNVIFIVSIVLDDIYKPFVIIHFAEFSLFYLWIAISDHRRRYYFLPGGLILFFALSPLWYTSVETNRYAAFGDTPESIYVVMGIVVLLMGILDHFSLKRVFGSLQEQGKYDG
jgi:hypothetical protein